ncbi:MAG: (2Fe-2S)-binding protein [Clostridia bacterium]|nr:(2Fe-2S)-binding protein [Clostridia bacterium]
MEIIVDGKKYIAENGETILQVARRNGIEIPTLCFLKGVNEPASCRVCVVEVEGVKNLCTACSTKVFDGMVVKTNTNKVIRARKNAIELLLSNHNQNCLSCPKNLQCQFQKLCNQFQCTNKFKGEMNEFAYDDTNHAIVRDESKCILCGKCVAVCAKRQGCSAIGKVGRGFETKVSTPFDRDMQHSACVGCGQCVLVCPTGALTQKNDTSKVMDILCEDDVVKIAQVAPAVRVSLGEAFGNEIGTFVEGKMVSALKELGFDFVFDVNTGADFTVVEEAGELLERLERKENLPLFTSCCPAWFNYCEKFYPEYANNMSTAKSPNEMLASLVRYYFEKQGKKVKIVSVMPCTAKKREILTHGVIDQCITTRELADLIKLKSINFNTLEDKKFDDPFGEATSSALIFGVTGGVTEAALRYAVFKTTGKKQGIVEEVRFSDGVKEVSVDLAGKKLNLAIVHGLTNAKAVMEEIKSGKRKYDFVEVMACPGGCVNGGGQIYVDYDKVDVEEVIKKRSASIYKVDGDCKFSGSEENKSVAKIYDELLGNDKHLIHDLLHYKRADKNFYE